MRVIDAFAGIGGFSLAADALGWETVAFVERDPDCQFWLGQHWPGVPIYGDICAVRWEDAPPCDVFTAGFPCQPHSVAGKRQASADDRDLWSECVRAIGVLRPRYACLENVPGLLTSESGRFFNRVLSDLAALGYVGRYDVLSAAACGAPHKRERVWIVAHPDGRRCEQRHASQRQYRESDSRYAAVGDPKIPRLQGRDELGRGRTTVARPGQGSRDLRHAWADAIPYRGADGTVRLIPAGAVADGDRGRWGNDGRSAEAIKGSDRAHDGVSGPNGGAIRGQEAVAGPESEVRALATRLPHGLAGRLAAEEVTPWTTPVNRDHHAPGDKQANADGLNHAMSLARDVNLYTGREVEAWATPVGQPAGSTAAAFIERKRNAIARGATMGLALSDCHLQATEFGGAGGSLWPVTDTEPGRVARLRAVGNAVVPAWVLAGPFRYILDREASR